MVTATYLSQCFSDYYANNLVALPPLTNRREWAFLDNGVMKRHHQYTDEQIHQAILAHAPAHIYHSAAYYENPAHPNIDMKGWKGADLIFDIDADQIPDKKGTWGGELEASKIETMSLINILMDELGLTDDDFTLNFSGARGYHIHVREPRVAWNDKIEKRERQFIVDYLIEKKIIFDYPVTIDTHRLIRLAGSLHAGTGLIAKSLTIKQIARFNPLHDAIAFSSEPVPVLVKKNTTVELAGKKYHVSEGAGELPQHLAVYLFCQDYAEYQESATKKHNNAGVLV